MDPDPLHRGGHLWQLSIATETVYLIKGRRHISLREPPLVKAARKPTTLDKTFIVAHCVSNL